MLSYQCRKSLCGDKMVKRLSYLNNGISYSGNAYWYWDRSLITPGNLLFQLIDYSTLLALCEGNPLVTGGFPSQRPVTRSFNVFFDMRLNKGLSKQARHRWYKTPSCSLWGQRDVLCTVTKLSQGIFSWWSFDNQTQDDRPPSPVVPGGNLRRSWGNTDWHGPLIPSLFQL